MVRSGSLGIVTLECPPRPWGSDRMLHHAAFGWIPLQQHHQGLSRIIKDSAHSIQSIHSTNSSLLTLLPQAGEILGKCFAQNSSFLLRTSKCSYGHEECVSHRIDHVFGKPVYRHHPIRSLRTLRFLVGRIDLAQGAGIPGTAPCAHGRNRRPVRPRSG